MPGVGYTKNFWPAMGLYTRGLYTEKFLMRIYTQKAAPGLRAKTEDFKKFYILHLQPKMGGGLYTRGGYTLQYSGTRTQQIFCIQMC